MNEQINFAQSQSEYLKRTRSETIAGCSGVSRRSQAADGTVTDPQGFLATVRQETAFHCSRAMALDRRKPLAPGDHREKKATSPCLRAAARNMVSEQASEQNVQRRAWRRWEDMLYDKPDVSS